MDHHENSSEYKGLTVNKGIKQPAAVNKDAVSRFLKRKKKPLSVDQYIEGILNGDITILSKAVTLVESSRPEHIEIAKEIIDRCLPYSGKSIRIGITGVPGAGKSTFIEAFGKMLTNRGEKIAVLAIDPSSERTKGSILGDKTRMEELSADSRAYIRPSPSAGSLGGVARKSRETIILCEAAGYNHIIVETVGVGQSEIAVHSMVDFFLLVQLAGAGDELQGIKRGVMEMADSIIINKADGNNIEKSEVAATQYRNALRLFPLSEAGIPPEVITCSALQKEKIEDVWNLISKYVADTKESNYFEKRRGEQARYWMIETINQALSSSFYQNPDIKEKLKETMNSVADNRVNPFHAAHSLLERYFKR